TADQGLMSPLLYQLSYPAKTINTIKLSYGYDTNCLSAVALAKAEAILPISTCLRVDVFMCLRKIILS
ncbi:MAG: hypothetical protein ACD_62C00318G0001, partial [uncultured bacterium]